ncbi:MAG: hypothetical protein AAGC55_00165, partial [Myxococcota bacterium]
HYRSDADGSIDEPSSQILDPSGKLVLPAISRPAGGSVTGRRSGRRLALGTQSDRSSAGAETGPAPTDLNWDTPTVALRVRQPSHSDGTAPPCTVSAVEPPRSRPPTSSDSVVSSSTEYSSSPELEDTPERSERRSWRWRRWTISGFALLVLGALTGLVAHDSGDQALTSTAADVTVPPVPGAHVGEMTAAPPVPGAHVGEMTAAPPVPGAHVGEMTAAPAVQNPAKVSTKENEAATDEPTDPDGDLGDELAEQVDVVHFDELARSCRRRLSEIREDHTAAMKCAIAACAVGRPRWARRFVRKMPRARMDAVIEGCSEYQIYSRSDSSPGRAR